MMLREERNNSKFAPRSRPNLSSIIIQRHVKVRKREKKLITFSGRLVLIIKKRAIKRAPIRAVFA